MLRAVRRTLALSWPLVLLIAGGCSARSLTAPAEPERGPRPQPDPTTVADMAVADMAVADMALAPDLAPPPDMARAPTWTVRSWGRGLGAVWASGPRDVYMIGG